ncbi:hypothetical protein CR513_00738, partial [Mucuna pruriens]
MWPRASCIQIVVPLYGPLNSCVRTWGGNPLIVSSSGRVNLFEQLTSSKVDEAIFGSKITSSQWRPTSRDQVYSYANLGDLFSPCTRVINQSFLSQSLRTSWRTGNEIYSVKDIASLKACSRSTTPTIAAGVSSLSPVGLAKAVAPLVKVDSAEEPPQDATEKIGGAANKRVTREGALQGEECPSNRWHCELFSGSAPVATSREDVDEAWFKAKELGLPYSLEVLQRYNSYAHIFGRAIEREFGNLAAREEATSTKNKQAHNALLKSFEYVDAQTKINNYQDSTANLQGDLDWAVKEMKELQLAQQKLESSQDYFCETEILLKEKEALASAKSSADEEITRLKVEVAGKDDLLKEKDVLLDECGSTIVEQFKGGFSHAMDISPSCATQAESTKSQQKSLSRDEVVPARLTPSQPNHTRLGNPHLTAQQPNRERPNCANHHRQMLRSCTYRRSCTLFQGLFLNSLLTHIIYFIFFVLVLPLLVAHGTAVVLLSIEEVQANGGEPPPSTLAIVEEDGTIRIRTTCASVASVCTQLRPRLIASAETISAQSLPRATRPSAEKSQHPTKPGGKAGLGSEMWARELVMRWGISPPPVRLSLDSYPWLVVWGERWYWGVPPRPTYLGSRGFKVYVVLVTGLASRGKSSWEADWNGSSRLGFAGIGLA